MYIVFLEAIFYSLELLYSALLYHFIKAPLVHVTSVPVAGLKGQRAFLSIVLEPRVLRITGKGYLQTYIFINTPGDFISTDLSTYS